VCEFVQGAAEGDEEEERASHDDVRWEEERGAREKGAEQLRE
jgi:hypothetical protein